MLHLINFLWQIVSAWEDRSFFQLIFATTMFWLWRMKNWLTVLFFVLWNTFFSSLCESVLPKMVMWKCRSCDGLSGYNKYFEYHWRQIFSPLFLLHCYSSVTTIFTFVSDDSVKLFFRTVFHQASWKSYLWGLWRRKYTGKPCKLQENLISWDPVWR